MARTICKVMGLVFVIVALWGFATGAQVLIFHVNPVHNCVHLLSGLIALLCAYRSERASIAFAWTFGIVYGLVGVLGFAGVPAAIDLLHLNPADNWLHAGIAVLFIAAAVASHVPSEAHTSQPPVPQHH